MRWDLGFAFGFGSCVANLNGWPLFDRGLQVDVAGILAGLTMIPITAFIWGLLHPKPKGSDNE